MNYIRQLNGFEDFSSRVGLSSLAQLVYYKVLSVNNRAQWAEWFEATNFYLMSRCSISDEKSFMRYRRQLIEKGLIEFVSGKKGQPSRYRVVRLYKDSAEVDEGESGSVYGSSLPVKEPDIIKDSLNKGNKCDLEDVFLGYAKGDKGVFKALCDFSKMRAEKRKPLTKRALDILFKELDRYGSTPDVKKAMLEKSVLCGYLGVYPVKGDVAAPEGSEWAKEVEKRRVKRPNAACKVCLGSGYYEVNSGTSEAAMTACSCWAVVDG